MLGAGSVRLRAFGRLAGLANPLGDYGQGVRLLALTGARRSEVFGMIWQEIDLSSKT
jgi:integrase